MVQLTHKNLAELIDFSQVNIFFSLIKNLIQTKLQTLHCSKSIHHPGKV
jgi:hypothetical protein